MQAHTLKRFIVTALLCLFCAGTAAGTEPLHISAAASMTDVIKELITSYVSTKQGHEVIPNFGSSGALAKQLSQGAPADIFISAHSQWMGHLEEADIIVSSSIELFAHSRLVFIAPIDQVAKGIGDLIFLDRIAIGNSASVPAGMYAKQALEKAGIFTELTKRNAFILTKDVRQAVRYAELGEVDGAIVYQTDAQLLKASAIQFTIPDTLHDKVSFYIGLTRDGSKKESALTFYNFLTSNKGIKVLHAYGFEG